MKFLRSAIMIENLQSAGLCLSRDNYFEFSLLMNDKYVLFDLIRIARVDCRAIFLPVLLLFFVLSLQISLLFSFGCVNYYLVCCALTPNLLSI